MVTSQTGIDLITKWEGFKNTAYKCPAGVWTIGYGHTKGVKKGDTCTKAQAVEYLKSDLASAEKNVRSFNKVYNWTQNEFDALVSFAFNIGSINQLTANGTRTKEVIANRMLLYRKAGGMILKGLENRRKEERALFIKK